MRHSSSSDSENAPDVAGAPEMRSNGFLQRCRKLNDAHLNAVENHWLGKLWAFSIVGTFFVAGALAARKAGFTQPTPESTGDGQYYLEKQYATGKSAKHAANAFEGKAAYTCDELDKARDQNETRLRADGARRRGPSKGRQTLDRLQRGDHSPSLSQQEPVDRPFAPRSQ